MWDWKFEGYVGGDAELSDFEDEVAGVGGGMEGEPGPVHGKRWREPFLSTIQWRELRRRSRSQRKSAIISSSVRERLRSIWDIVRRRGERYQRYQHNV